jgi:hypothetical protein
MIPAFFKGNLIGFFTQRPPGWGQPGVYAFPFVGIEAVRTARGKLPDRVLLTMRRIDDSRGRAMALDVDGDPRLLADSSAFRALAVDETSSGPMAALSLEDLSPLATSWSRAADSRRLFDLFNRATSWQHGRF